MSPSQKSPRVPSRLDQIAFKAAQTLWYPLSDRQRQLNQKLRALLSDRPSDSKVINQKEIRVIGLRRTGNHAIINWIEKQQPGNVRHLNDVAAGTNPYRYKANNLRRYHPEHHRMAEIYWQQAKGDFVQRDCLVYSYEDWSLKKITQPRFERNRTLYLGRCAHRYDVLILRDPFNLFASRLKKGYVATKQKTVSMTQLWLEYAKEWVKEDQRLLGDRVLISYNRWFIDVDYRRNLADQLDIPFSDSGLNEVSTIGTGSSFDGTALDGQARKMDVTNRWRAFADDSAFRQIFQDEAIWHYSQQIFGHLPGTEVLRT